MSSSVVRSRCRKSSSSRRRWELPLSTRPPGPRTRGRSPPAGPRTPPPPSPRSWRCCRASSRSPCAAADLLEGVLGPQHRLPANLPGHPTRGLLEGRVGEPPRDGVVGVVTAHGRDDVLADSPGHSRRCPPGRRRHHGPGSRQIVLGGRRGERRVHGVPDDVGDGRGGVVQSRRRRVTDRILRRVARQAPPQPVRDPLGDRLADPAGRRLDLRRRRDVLQPPPALRLVRGGQGSFDPGLAAPSDRGCTPGESERERDGAPGTQALERNVRLPTLAREANVSRVRA